MNRNSSIETSIGTHYIDNDVLHIVFKEGADVDVKEILESKQARLDLQNGKPMKILVDSRGLFHISKEARDIAAEDQHAKMSVAMALVSSSLGTRMISNFFIKFNKPNVPTKNFTSMDKALLWLNEFN
ncbi:MAG: hypothetical protein P1U41_09260 [Vicingaceae bacterium]|nr:hypothetical protein [Vicingaceae bacterium]